MVELFTAHPKYDHVGARLSITVAAPLAQLFMILNMSLIAQDRHHMLVLYGCWQGVGRVSTMLHAESRFQWGLVSE